MRDMALGFKESGESGRQLLVNYEFHAPLNTAWSA